MTDDKFALKWNDFQTNTVQNYCKLRNSSVFNDVTLVGDDHKLISAHKVILTSCSEYFRTILTKHEHSHPLICLDGVNSQDIENALDFIYKGELFLFHDDLDRFLLIAQKLKLEGLLNKNEEEYESPILKNDEPLIEVEKFYEDIKESFHHTAGVKDKTNILITDKISSIEELDIKLRENIQRINGGAKCIICGKFYSNPGHALEHIEAVHTEGLQFDCKICGKTFHNRKALRNHKYKNHKN